MSDICGFGGFKIVDGPGGPDQSFRVFVPIFLHAGVVHLLLNMLAQCTSSAQVRSVSLHTPPRRRPDAPCLAHRSSA